MKTIYTEEEYDESMVKVYELLNISELDIPETCDLILHVIALNNYEKSFFQKILHSDEI